MRQGFELRKGGDVGCNLKGSNLLRKSRYILKLRNGKGGWGTGDWFVATGGIQLLLVPLEGERGDARKKELQELTNRVIGG